tara:strand:+ start:935 stop:1180 length:246 start_codon:yes stop_codon:yes gene_type:complete
MYVKGKETYKMNTRLTKQKSRGKPSKTPKGMCRYCKEKISPENMLYYTQGGIKTECKPCRRQLSRESNRRRRKILKDNPLW